MNKQVLKDVAALERKVGYVLVATADSSGVPHVAVARNLTPIDEDRVSVRAWFCPGTMANVQENRHIALVVWDPASDIGYQLLGDLERVEDMAMMDGYVSDAKESSLPQVERRLWVHVEKVTGFTRGAHTEREI